VVGTHPIPEKYYLTHTKLETWKNSEWNEILDATLKEKEVRLSYD
jgi:hypothetical protein